MTNQWHFFRLPMSASGTDYDTGLKNLHCIKQAQADYAARFIVLIGIDSMFKTFRYSNTEDTECYQTEWTLKPSSLSHETYSVHPSKRTHAGLSARWTEVLSSLIGFLHKLTDSFTCIYYSTMLLCLTSTCSDTDLYFSI